MPTYDLLQVDVFTKIPLNGNPCAVIFDTDNMETAIMQAIARVGADRICFGSDTPFRWQHVILAMYRAMMRDLSEADQAKVFGGNLARLLSLSS
jgi:predicted TIM-barrel fold metal-dependent hydrolase